MRLFCTDPDAARAAAVRQAVRGTALADKVEFARPDLEALVEDGMRTQLLRDVGLAGRLPHRTLVTFGGHPDTARVCARGAAAAAGLADRVGCGGHELHFRQEFYGLVAGGCSLRSRPGSLDCAPGPASSVESPANALSLADSARLVDLESPLTVARVSSAWTSVGVPMEHREA